MQSEIRNWEWFGAGLLLATTYVSGLFIPLMENDSAQHASMAMRMVLQDDFIHLYKGSQPYLDKPHLHFWLAALSMKIFGINAIAYRIPSLLFLLLGAVSTFRLSKLLYANRQTAILSALVFLSSQTIVLSAHDVRTDAILTGAVIFGIYHFVALIRTGKIQHIPFAALGAAMSLASKGMVGVGIIGLSVLAYLLYTRAWKQFFTWRIILVLLCFAAFTIPLLYAYYVQFDLKPEQVVRGETGVSGVRFILWDQSFKRFSGEDFGVSSPDYLFFFHSLLWLLIPFSVIFYHALFVRTKFFITNKFRFQERTEFLTLGGFWAVILFFSLSQFKLPHYMNSIIPLCAILTGGYISQLTDSNRSEKTIRIHLYIQYVLFATGIALISYLVIFAFGIVQPLGFALVVIVFGILFAILFGKRQTVTKFVLSSIVFAAGLNLFLNTNFYPPLTTYQAGWQISKKIKEAGIDPQHLLLLDGYTNWTLDFYTKTNIPRVSEEQVKQSKGHYLFVDMGTLEELRSRGLQCEEIMQATQYRITMVKPSFLNAKTREGELGKFVLVKII